MFSIVNPNMFQFHNGTINTDLFRFFSLCRLCFNSTTVQLIQFIDGENGISNLSFNSTTVQLILLSSPPSYEGIHVSIPQRYN